MKTVSLQNRIKAIAGVCIALLMMMPVMTGAQEAGTPGLDLSRTGTISVSLEESSGNKAADISLALYKVADLALDNGDMVYTFTPDFADCGASLEDVTQASVAETLADWLKQHQPKPVLTRSSDKAGKAVFTDLSLGLYMVTQRYITKDKANYFNTFVVSLPLDMDGVWTYEVSANPKLVKRKVEKSPEDPEDPKKEQPGKPTGQGGTGEVPSSGTKLPQTGQLNWPIPVLVLCGVCLLIAGTWLGKEGKEHAA